MLKIDWDITSHLEPLPLDSSFGDQAAVCGRVQDDAKATEYICIYIYICIYTAVPGMGRSGVGLVAQRERGGVQPFLYIFVFLNTYIYMYIYIYMYMYVYINIYMYIYIYIYNLFFEYL